MDEILLKRSDHPLMVLQWLGLICCKHTLQCWTNGESTAFKHASVNENISIRISNALMILSRSFLMQIPFIQNINTYIFADKISPDLAMELLWHFRPSPLQFQAQDLSSCALFLVLSFLRRVPSNWMVSSSLVSVPFANDTCPQHWLEHGSKDMPGNCGNRCKFTPNLVSSHCSGSQAWIDLGLQCRQRCPCFQSHG